MPTVLRVGPYRFFFFAGDRDEPAHVHVESGSNMAKLWLQPVRLDRSGGFSRRDLGAIQRIVEDHEGELLEAWRGYFED
ncbi:MAG TPA: DUF4160 domain-containing protein [Dehalococcoidia bacterium]|nr:DUF4160 domain-containing protein [Dehalococcoidia bacterium]